MSAIRTKKIIPVGVMKDIVLSTKFKMNTNFREVKEFLHSIDEFTTSISKDNIKIHPEIFPELKGFMECYEFYSKSKIKAVQIQFTGLRYGGISDICPVPHSQMRIVMFLQATKGYNELSIVAEGTEVSIPLPGSIGFIVPSNLSHLKIQANKIPFNSRRELKLGLFIIVDIEATDDQSGNMADNYLRVAPITQHTMEEAIGAINPAQHATDPAQPVDAVASPVSGRMETADPAQHTAGATDPAQHTAGATDPAQHTSPASEPMKEAMIK